MGRPKDPVSASLEGFVKEDYTTRLVTMITTEPDGRTRREGGVQVMTRPSVSALFAITTLRNIYLLAE